MYYYFQGAPDIIITHQYVITRHILPHLHPHNIQTLNQQSEWMLLQCRYMFYIYSTPFPQTSTYRISSCSETLRKCVTHQSPLIYVCYYHCCLGSHKSQCWLVPFATGISVCTRRLLPPTVHPIDTRINVQ